MSKKRGTRRSRRHQRYRRKVKMTIFEAFERFPSNEYAEQWFERQRWGEQHEDFHCPWCGCIGKTKTMPDRKPMPYRCGHCHRFFSVRTRTVMAHSNLSYQKWAVAIYTFICYPKGISSFQLHRHLGVTQKTAWFIEHRIRKAFEQKGVPQFEGPVEVDETYLGGKRHNQRSKPRLPIKGRGVVGKEIVVGMRDRRTKQVRLEHLPNTKRKTLHKFVKKYARDGVKLYTDEHASYQGLPNHETVQHKKREFSRGKVSTNGIESVWALLKREYHGTYHHWSPKHLQRYLDEASGRYNLKDKGTDEQMRSIVTGMVGKRLLYRELVRD